MHSFLQIGVLFSIKETAFSTLKPMISYTKLVREGNQVSGNGASLESYKLSNHHVTTE